MGGKVFPMLDGPSIPWGLALILHQMVYAAKGVMPDRPLDSVAAQGGYRWGDMGRTWELLKRKDRMVYRKIAEQARELAEATGELQLPVVLVPESQAPPAPMPEGGLGPLVVVCWKWKPARHPPRYTSQHVNVLARMVANHYRGEYRFVCITDDPTGLDKGIETFPLWQDHAHLPNPSGPNHLPSCFRRLKVFTGEMGEALRARRIVSIDLDVVITGDMTPLWDRPDPFVGWRVPSASRNRYAFNGSMWLCRPGIFEGMWKEFHPVRSVTLAHTALYFGSDQSWMSYYLRDLDCPGWTAMDGVYSFPREVRNQGKLPRGARIVIFHGGRKPWDRSAAAGHPWIYQHWR